MTALRKILIEEETVFTAPVTRTPAKLYLVANNATPAVEEGSAVKNIVLCYLVGTGVFTLTLLWGTR